MSELKPRFYMVVAAPVSHEEFPDIPEGSRMTARSSSGTGSTKPRWPRYIQDTRRGFVWS